MRIWVTHIGLLKQIARKPWQPGRMIGQRLQRYFLLIFFQGIYGIRQIFIYRIIRFHFPAVIKDAKSVAVKVLLIDPISNKVWSSGNWFLPFSFSPYPYT